jgi:acetate kinase
MKVLVLNSGSSSQKSCLYELNDHLPESPPEPLWKGQVEWQGERATLEIHVSGRPPFKEEHRIAARTDATARLLEALSSGASRVLTGKSEVSVVGHRIVNGGPELAEPARITPGVKEAIEKAAALAPLHNRVELEGIRMIEETFGAVPQVAVFDTAFHRQMPEAAAVYPGPYEWVGQGIRRYGFHGINHQYCAERAAQLLGMKLASLKLVTCHLGNGCSLAAIRDGHSVDTTMGFTPLDGLMMGTRSGSVDPGILTFLLRERKLGAEGLDRLLNQQSGLLGISGISGDMRKILSAMKEGHARARLAFDIFVHRLQSGMGAMIAVLGDIDALVFTGGIGENACEVRSAACANFAFLGLTLDAAKNLAASGDQEISAADSSVRVLVIHAEEDWAIARECWKLARREP